MYAIFRAHANSFPVDVTNSDCLRNFQRQLKSTLFRQQYTVQQIDVNHFNKYLFLLVY